MFYLIASLELVIYSKQQFGRHNNVIMSFSLHITDTMAYLQTKQFQLKWFQSSSDTNDNMEKWNYLYSFKSSKSSIITVKIP